MPRLLLAVSTLFMVGACAGAASGGSPCPNATGFTCSTLTVPLDHSGRRPGTLHLAVATSDNVNAPRGVLLLLTGGPGQPGVPALARISRILGAEQRAYRIVVLDQRGTGAGALDCPALQQAMGSSDLTPPPAAAVRACATQLGSRRQFFGTDDVVADLESLRKALGVEKWVVDGISYGTYVGERYALAHPSHVSKLVLDSVVPHQGETDLGLDEFRGTRRVLRDVCGGNACVGDLAAAVRKTGKGPAIFDALTLQSIVDPSFRSTFDVPRLLHLAANGEPTELLQFLSIAKRWEVTPAQALDQGLHASALCADWRYPWGDSSTPIAGREAKLRAAVARQPPSTIYPFDRKTALGNGFIRQCLPWSPTPPTPLPPRGAKLQVPTLLVNGDHDLSTPLEWAREELALAPRGKLVVVHGAGHSVQSRAISDAGRRAVAAFLLG
ncbi:MAG TPA: alpha/beta hydrolase [Gaiellaceae bacterium]|jgi:pimeloyl-ACP methyl ester carboxylesterase|nr:alpha/beta hydrolase [Gaiellaceae bacterium]